MPHNLIRNLRYVPIGGGYSSFAGREASRALAKMSLLAADCNGDLDDLSPREVKVLQEWEEKLIGKYVTVGQVCPCHDLGSASYSDAQNLAATWLGRAIPSHLHI